MTKSILVSACLCLVISSCGDYRLKRFTPKKYLNNVHVPHEYYAKDSVQILDTLKSWLAGRRDFFYSKEYFDSTQLLIDTIIHDSTFKKFIAFVMTENPTYRQLYPDTSTSLYYNATAFIGLRKNEDIRLARVGYYFTNSPSRSALSGIIRNTFFTEIANSDTTFNMNDIRYWNSGDWRKIEAE